MKSIEEFMNSPLVVWAKTFTPEDAELRYQDFCNGTSFKDLIHQIIPRPVNLDHIRNSDDMISKMINLDIVVRNIHCFYREMLQQLMLMRPPDIATIAKQPDSESARQELQRVLLLLLACAVQCDRKEMFIERITQLALGVQEALMQAIQQVLEDHDSVLPLEMLGERAPFIRHLEMMDNSVLLELGRELERRTSEEWRPGAEQLRQMQVELTQSRGKLVQVRHDLEEKNAEGESLREETRSLREQLSRIEGEKLMLLPDARAARVYRDEIDVLKEQAHRATRLESENAKLRERLDECEHTKRRLEEMEENQLMLQQTNSILEEQLDAARKRMESLVAVEAELFACKQTIHQMDQERDKDGRRLEELLEENSRLEVAMRNSLNESFSLGEELQELRLIAFSEPPLGHELSLSRLTRLELENQQLKAQFGHADKDTALHHLQTENAELRQRLESERASALAQLEDIQIQLREARRRTDEELRKKCAEWDKEIDRLRREAEQQHDGRSERRGGQSILALREQLARSEEESRLKDERISSLEHRLADAIRSNNDLRDELKLLSGERVKRENGLNVLQQSARELLELKDHLVAMERRNAALMTENEHLQNQAQSFQQECNDQRRAIDALRSTQLSLQAENARLAVELATALAHKQELQAESSRLAAYRDQLLAKMDDIQSGHEQLSAQHDALQRVHEQLVAECHALTDRLAELQTSHKDVRAENQEVKDSRLTLERERDRVLQESRLLHDRLASLQTSLAESERQARTAQEHRTDAERELAALRLRQGQLLSELGALRENNAALDLQASKLAAKCESLAQMSDKLDEENKALLLQLRHVLQQNQELLDEALQSRDVFHHEYRSYLEQLNKLKRQKEQLEQKIMDQFKNYEPQRSKKNRRWRSVLGSALRKIQRRNDDDNSSDDMGEASPQRAVELTNFRRIEEEPERETAWATPPKAPSPGSEVIPLTQFLEETNQSPELRGRTASLGQGAQPDCSLCVQGETGPCPHGQPLLSVSWLQREMLSSKYRDLDEVRPPSPPSRGASNAASLRRHSEPGDDRRRPEKSAVWYEYGCV